MKQDLPPLDLVLTPQERDRCQIVRIDLERRRRQQNELDEKMRQARETRALMKALYYDGGPEAA